MVACRAERGRRRSQRRRFQVASAELVEWCTNAASSTTATPSHTSKPSTLTALTAEARRQLGLSLESLRTRWAGSVRGPCPSWVKVYLRFCFGLVFLRATAGWTGFTTRC